MLWCTMDLTEPYVSFNGMDTCSTFMLELNKTAFKELVKVYGGNCVDEMGLFWSWIDDCWEEE